MLLDEPTASLDLRRQAGVPGRGRRVARPHRAARHAEAVLLDRGRVAAAGPPAEALDARRLPAGYAHPVEVVAAPGGVVVAPGPDARDRFAATCPADGVTRPTLDG